ncbi:Fasciclin-like arabinogalactan protein 11 [Asimina triloba]
MERLPLFLSFAVAAFHVLSIVSAQSAAPTPSGPANITAILEKAGQYTTLIRLFKTTALADQINSQLNNSNGGLTIFAPTDNAFQSLKAGTLNGLSDQQKVSLMQFHVLPSFISLSQFQTISNPVRTQAGSGDAYPLNVATSGNQVNISTGIDDATVGNTVYTDGQLAVYQVDKVLLPLSIFGAKTPAPAPAPAKANKPTRSTAAAPTADVGTADNSKAASLNVRAALESLAGVVAAVGFAFWLG